MGHRGLNNTFDTNMKLFVTLAGLLAAAQAEAFYGYGYGLHQQNWPTAYGPGFERTIWGARGKRDADAFHGYGGLGLGSGGFIRQSRVHPGYGGYAAGGFAHLVGKRSADAFGYGYAPFRALGGAGLHPTGASYSNRSPQGAYGKRDAEAHYGYSYAPLIGRGVAIHPGFATSYTQRSPQGLHKRDADAEALGLGAGGFIRQSRPGLAQFGIHHNGYGAFAHPVGKRDADADAAIGYSNRSPQGAYGLGYGRGYYWG